MLAARRRGPPCSTARALSRWAMRRARRRCGAASSSASERRLVARQLAVGVVADERAVGDRAVEALLGRGHPRVELRRRPPRRAPWSASNAGLQRARVRDEVVAARRAEHDALGRAQPPQLDGEHDREDQRDERDAAAPRARRGPAGSVRSFTSRARLRARRALSRAEQRRVLGLVVVGLLLAGDRGDGRRGSSPRVPIGGVLVELSSRSPSRPAAICGTVLVAS